LVNIYVKVVFHALLKKAATGLEVHEDISPWVLDIPKDCIKGFEEYNYLTNL